LLENPAYVRYKGMHGCHVDRADGGNRLGASTTPDSPGHASGLSSFSSSSLKSKGPRMALKISRLTIPLCAIGVFVAAGCSSPAVMDTLPEPNFNGPVVSAPPPAPAPTFTTPPTTPAPAQKAPVASGRMTGPRDWTPTVAARPWRYIVIHHSATPSGSAAEFDRMHKAKGWDELGYHFVIGNGTGSGNGQVEVGSRWRAQKWGAHAKTADNRFNDYGIGICLVGNFDIDRPTAAQVASLSKLVAFLEKTYRITDTNIVGHGQTKATDCPGKFMNVAQIKSMARQALAEAGESTGPLAVTAGGDMLQDAHAGQ